MRDDPKEVFLDDKWGSTCTPEFIRAMLWGLRDIPLSYRQAWAELLEGAGEQAWAKSVVTSNPNSMPDAEKERLVAAIVAARYASVGDIPAVTGDAECEANYIVEGRIRPECSDRLHATPYVRWFAITKALPRKLRIGLEPADGEEDDRSHRGPTFPDDPVPYDVAVLSQLPFVEITQHTQRMVIELQ